MKTKDKKAQMEMMGIAIVVVLLLVGLALVVSFVILRPPSDIREEYVESQLASNTIGAILRTTVPECREQMDDLLIDYASGFPRIRCDEGISTEEAIEGTLDTIFNQTLYEFGTQFYFEVSVQGATEEIVVSKASEGAVKDCRPREQATYLLPTTYGKDLNILLQICTGE
jgi:hypothetical protein